MTCGRIRKLDKLGNMKKDLTFETAKKKEEIQVSKKKGKRQQLSLDKPSFVIRTQTLQDKVQGPSLRRIRKTEPEKQGAHKWLAYFRWECTKATNTECRTTGERLVEQFLQRKPWQHFIGFSHDSNLRKK